MGGPSFSISRWLSGPTIGVTEITVSEDKLLVLPDRGQITPAGFLAAITAGGSNLTLGTDQLTLGSDNLVLGS